MYMHIAIWMYRCIKSIHCFYSVKWQPVEMSDLLIMLEPIAANWEKLAFNLIKTDRLSLKGHFTTVAL